MYSIFDTKPEIQPFFSWFPSPKPPPTKKKVWTPCHRVYCGGITPVLLYVILQSAIQINYPLNFELNPICHLLALLGAHLIFHVTRIRVKPDATVSQVYSLTFMCGSTCFGRFHAHHQELAIALAASGFTLGAWWFS